LLAILFQISQICKICQMHLFVHICEFSQISQICQIHLFVHITEIYLLSVFLQICFVRFVTSDSIRFFSFVCSYLFVQMYICAVSFDQISLLIVIFSDLLIHICLFFIFFSSYGFLFRFVMFRFVLVHIILLIFKSVNFSAKSVYILEKC
jgi:hypothetical protein